MKIWPWRQIDPHQQKKNRNNKISYQLLTQNEQCAADFDTNGITSERSIPEVMGKTYEVNHQFESHGVSAFFFSSIYLLKLMCNNRMIINLLLFDQCAITT